MSDTLYYLDTWNDPEYVKSKQGVFTMLEHYLPNPPKRILDIGCGYAHISEMFQKKYGTELYLLDGDFSKNSQQATRVAKYGATENFMFYVSTDDLKKEWDRKGMTYTFIDANNIDISNDVEFDLVYSWISCGFHYPVSTYKKLIQKHTTAHSTIIMDFRRKSLNEQMKDFDIVQRLDGEAVRKKYKLHIQFKD
jgi:SAM-dependent methyltransferase